MDDLNYNEMVGGTNVSQLKASQLNKKKQHISQFAKNMEKELINYSDDDSDGSVNLPLNSPPKRKPKQNSILNNLFNFSKFKDYDILLLTVIFLLLNTNQSISFVSENLKSIKSINFNYSNLVVRTLIFGLLFFIVKKLM